MFEIDGGYHIPAGTFYGAKTFGYRATAQADNAVRFLMSSGNIADGEFSAWGVLAQ